MCVGRVISVVQGFGFVDFSESFFFLHQVGVGAGLRRFSSTKVFISESRKRKKVKTSSHFFILLLSRSLPLSPPPSPEHPSCRLSRRHVRIHQTHAGALVVQANRWGASSCCSPHRWEGGEARDCRRPPARRRQRLLVDDAEQRRLPAHFAAGERNKPPPTRGAFSRKARRRGRGSAEFERHRSAVPKKKR